MIFFYKIFIIFVFVILYRVYEIMKKILSFILLFAMLSMVVNAKNQTLDEFWKEIQKTKGDKALLIKHCTDYLQDGDFKITNEEFIANDIAISTFAKWITKLSKANKYSAKLKENTKIAKDNSSAEIKYYKYGSETNYSTESNFYILHTSNKTSANENGEWIDKNYDVEFCFALRGGTFKIVGFSYLEK